MYTEPCDKVFAREFVFESVLRDVACAGNAREFAIVSAPRRVPRRPCPWQCVGAAAPRAADEPESGAEVRKARTWAKGRDEKKGEKNIGKRKKGEKKPEKGRKGRKKSRGKERKPEADMITILTVTSSGFIYSLKFVLLLSTPID